VEQKILQCKLTIHNIENKIGQNQAYSSVTPTCTISCGQITDKFMIHCSKCQQWTHYKCTLLPAYQLYMFVSTTRKFTCEMCSNVPIRFKQKWDHWISVSLFQISIHLCGCLGFWFFSLDWNHGLLSELYYTLYDSIDNFKSLWMITFFLCGV
jgi:hypothetical protein